MSLAIESESPNRSTGRAAVAASLLDRVLTPSRNGAPEPFSTGWGVGAPLIERGAVHEWFASSPPMGLLAGLARRAAGRVVWVGRGCWAHAGWDVAAALLDRSVFVDPSGDAERLWAIDQALRCAGVACVIGDGRRLDMGASRRLQLAAQSRGVVGLLARPPDEISTLSAARTRWRVGPSPNPDARWYPEPRWTVELLRCKGMRPSQDAREWVVQLSHDTGDVTLVPRLTDRGLATPPAPRRLA